MPKFTVRTLLIVTLLVCVSLGLPSLIQKISRSITINRAIDTANRLWNSDAAFVYRDDETLPPNFFISYNYDPETGLPVRRSFPQDELYVETFNANVTALINENGLPEYSVKHLVPEPKQLDAEFSATGYTLVDSFPFKINEFITLKFNPYLQIDANPKTAGKKGVLAGIDYGNLPVEYKIEGDLVYIRYGKKWIGVFHREGWQIANGGK